MASGTDTGCIPSLREDASRDRAESMPHVISVVQQRVLGQENRPEAIIVEGEEDNRLASSSGNEVDTTMNTQRLASRSRGSSFSYSHNE